MNESKLRCKYKKGVTHLTKPPVYHTDGKMYSPVSSTHGEILKTASAIETAMNIVALATRIPGHILSS